jgi:hypothetical protein
LPSGGAETLAMPKSKVLTEPARIALVIKDGAIAANPMKLALGAIRCLADHRRRRTCR